MFVVDRLPKHVGLWSATAEAGVLGRQGRHVTRLEQAPMLESRGSHGLGLPVWGDTDGVKKITEYGATRLTSLCHGQSRCIQRPPHPPLLECESYVGGRAFSLARGALRISVCISCSCRATHPPAFWVLRVWSYRGFLHSFRSDQSPQSFGRLTQYSVVTFILFFWFFCLESTSCAGTLRLLQHHHTTAPPPLSFKAIMHRSESSPLLSESDLGPTTTTAGTKSASRYSNESLLIHSGPANHESSRPQRSSLQVTQW